MAPLSIVRTKPADSANDLILRLNEHEVQRYGLVHLHDLPEERLEIIELEVGDGSPAAGRAVKDLGLPDGSLVTVQPEWEDVAAVAAALGRPAREVLAEASDAARAATGSFDTD